MTGVLLYYIFLVVVYYVQSEKCPSIIHPRIIGGQNQKQEKAKFMASMRLKCQDSNFGRGYHCGGSLIRPNLIITAAHCLTELDPYTYKFEKRRPQNLKIVLGSVYLSKKEHSTLEFDVEAYVTHENYSMNPYINDIGILLLSGRVSTWQHAVRPVELNKQEITPGTSCQVMGWGITGDLKKGHPEILQVADVQIMKSEICKKVFRTGITSGVLCAGVKGGQKDACWGDSGGPLICNGILVGIVSYGLPCGQTDSLGVYTNIASYRDWIDTRIVMYSDSKSYNLSENCSVFVVLLSTLKILL